MTLRDECVESLADAAGLDLLDPRLARCVEQDEPEATVGGLLVALQRVPRGVRVDGDRLRLEDFLDRAGFLVETGQAQRGREPESDRSAVRHGVARRGLERVRERVPEVELDPLAALERVAQADRGLERGAPADLLVRLELPEPARRPGAPS